MPNVTLSSFNTSPVAAASGVYRFKLAQTGLSGIADLLNLGPGTVYIRDSPDPATNDAGSLALPAGIAFNGLPVTPFGIGIIAAADSTVSIRMR